MLACSILLGVIHYRKWVIIGLYPVVQSSWGLRTTIEKTIPRAARCAGQAASLPSRHAARHAGIRIFGTAPPVEDAPEMVETWG